MGLFKDTLERKDSFMNRLGFEFDERSGPRGEYGWTRTICHNNIERLWITIDPLQKKLYLYNEWEIGGELWDREDDIPDGILENEEDFIEWLDNKIQKLM